MQMGATGGAGLPISEVAFRWGGLPQPQLREFAGVVEKVLPAPDCLQDGSSGHPCRQQEGRDEAVGVGREAPRVMCTNGYLRLPCDPGPEGCCG